MPASTQFGSWKATTSPGPTPLACSDHASERAARSTSPKLPAQGWTPERTRNVTPLISSRPAATIAPSVASFHHPRARYDRARSPGTARSCQRGPTVAVWSLTSPPSDRVGSTPASPVPLPYSENSIIIGAWPPPGQRPRSSPPCETTASTSSASRVSSARQPTPAPSCSRSPPSWRRRSPTRPASSARSGSRSTTSSISGRTPCPRRQPLTPSCR